MSESVLITGAAGFIGSHLTERCLDLGWNVTAVDVFTDYYDPSLKRANLAVAAEHPNCTVVEGDLLVLDLRAILETVTIVFHLAAQPGVRESWNHFDLYERRNVSATHRLLDAARHVSLKRFVLASSSSIYGDAESLPTQEDLTPRPVSPYGITKVAAELLAYLAWRNFGLPTIRLRYFTVYGPRQRPEMAFSRLIANTLAGSPFDVFGDGTQTRDFTFVTDAVSGTIAAASRGQLGSAYNIGGGSRHSMNEVITVLGDVTGRHVERRYRARSISDARHTAADIGRARRDLGFDPSCPLEAGLAAQLEWQCSRTSSTPRGVVTSARGA
jgi:nucleoside-diphosphate-sugar epimerase